VTYCLSCTKLTCKHYRTVSTLLAITFLALDIKVKEQSDENLARGRKVFEPPRFMTCQQAAQQLLSAVQVSVADPDPGSGAFLTPGSGIRNTFFPYPGSQIPDPKTIFLRA
jgi:hypothetical protein